MTTEEMKFFEDLFRSLESEMNQKFGEMRQEMREEFSDVRARLDRMGARLDKIAAGAHYVSRLVEWSEKQDQFQLETHQRLTEIDARLRKLEGH
jgi:hypothetical protein